MAPDETSQALIAAVERVWPELPGLVEGDWSKFEPAVLAGLCTLDDAALAVAAAHDDESMIAAIAAVDAAEIEFLRLFGPHPDAAERLNQQYNEELERGPKLGPSAPPAGSERRHRYFDIPIFYATDRKPAEDPVWYSGERAPTDELSYGVVRVSVPTARKIGDVPKPAWWHQRLSPQAFNPQKWSEVLAVGAVTASGFVTEARALTGAGDSNGEAASAPGAQGRDVLILIHGYNVSFRDAAKRAAQLAYDLDFTGVMVLYSWPTRSRYEADKESADWSIAHFVHFLQTVLPGIGARQIHVVAHSMGNRILYEALHELSRDDGKPLGRVVFAAPDVDEGKFGQRAKDYENCATSCTLYISRRDLALRVSEILAGYPRRGRSSEVISAPTVETVDASHLPKKDLLGHSGFAQDRAMLNDMKDIFLYGRPADQRSALQAETDSKGNRYWAFPA